MARLTEEQKAPFLHVNYAHRGLHSLDKSIPENSLAAFKAARNMGYGAELDVQLSKDGQVVVFHDDTLDRVCKVHGRVDEYPYEELHQMSLCGTKETIPLFTDVLEAFYGGGPLVVELKTAGRKNAELCEKTLAILRNYQGVFCIESFDPRIVYWFKKNAPDIVRGQLSNPSKGFRTEYGPLISFALAHVWGNLITKPDFNAYDIGKRPRRVMRERKKGVMLIAWTSHDPVNEKDNDAVIFEFYQPEVRY